MKKLSFLILAFCLLILIVACGQREQAIIGELAPDFYLVDLKGKYWTLAELKGQVVFINFWATWCTPCREEMPSMQKLYTMLSKEKFKMLAVLNKDDPALAKNFATKLNLTMPILSDQFNFVGPRYGLTGLPETFIVDKQGVLREKFIGPAQWDTPEKVQLLMKYINEE